MLSISLDKTVLFWVSPALPRRFQQKLWKTLLKRAYYKGQTSEIHGLLADCTHFVQTG
jgi:hypothetical protein